MQQLGTIGEQGRVESDRLHEQVDPLPCREPFAYGKVVFAIVVRHLHRHEAVQPPRNLILLPGIRVHQHAQTPDASNQQFRILPHCFGIHDHPADARFSNVASY